MECKIYEKVDRKLMLIHSKQQLSYFNFQMVTQVHSGGMRDGAKKFIEHKYNESNFQSIQLFKKKFYTCRITLENAIRIIHQHKSGQCTDKLELMIQVFLS